MLDQEKTGVGIVNPYGDLWSTCVYDTPEAAIASLRAFWKNVSDFDEAKWALTPVRLIVTPMFPAERWKLCEYALPPSDEPREEAFVSTSSWPTGSARAFGESGWESRSAP